MHMQLILSNSIVYSAESDCFHFLQEQKRASEQILLPSG